MCLIHKNTNIIVPCYLLEIDISYFLNICVLGPSCNGFIHTLVPQILQSSCLDEFDFTRLQISDKQKSTSEEPNSLPNPSNHLCVLFLDAFFFSLLKWKVTVSPEKRAARNVAFIFSVCSPWSSSDLLDLRRKVSTKQHDHLKKSQEAVQ